MSKFSLEQIFNIGAIWSTDSLPDLPQVEWRRRRISVLDVLITRIIVADIQPGLNRHLLFMEDALDEASTI